MGNNTYLPGDSVNIHDIGTQPKERSDPGLTLICVTVNVNKHCCRQSDKGANMSRHRGAVGDYHFPNGSLVIRGANYTGDKNTFFVRYGYTHQVRLGSIGTPAGPLGNYSCVVPSGSNGESVTAIIHISSGKSNMVSKCYNVGMSEIWIYFTSTYQVKWH